MANNHFFLVFVENIFPCQFPFIFGSGFLSVISSLYKHILDIFYSPKNVLVMGYFSKIEYQILCPQGIQSLVKSYTCK